MPTNTTDREGPTLHMGHGGNYKHMHMQHAFDEGKMAAQAQSAERIKAMRDNLQFSLTSARDYAIKHDSTHHHGVANAFEISVGLLDEYLGNIAKSALSPHNPAGGNKFANK